MFFTTSASQAHSKSARAAMQVSDKPSTSLLELSVPHAMQAAGMDPHYAALLATRIKLALPEKVSMASRR